MLRRTCMLSLVVLAGLTILSTTPAARAAVFTVDSTADAPDATPGNGVCDTGGASCTLRAAIEEINALGLDVIYFEDFEAGAGGWTSSGLNDTWSARNTYCNGDSTAGNRLASDGNWGPTCTAGSSLEQSRILSPPIPLPTGPERLDLSLDHRFTENGPCTTSSSGTDRKSLGLTTDGGASVTILNDCFELERRPTFDVSAFAGQTVQVVIDYDTVDDVGQGRVAIDDVRIRRQPRIEFNLALPAVIQLTRGQLEVEQPFDLLGPGPEDLTVLGGAAAAANPDVCARVARVETDRSEERLEMSGFTFSNGLVEPDCEDAGGSTDDDGGGGLFHDNGQLTLSDCAFTLNVADETDGGGAILARDDLTIDDCVIDGNRADRSDGGGGLAQDFNRLTVRNSRITNNSADDADDGGGGIRNGDELVVYDSVIRGNHFDITDGSDPFEQGGGGIYSDSEPVLLFNVEISDNRSNNTTGGGGVYFQSATAVFVNVTISGNEALNAESGGGGFDNEESDTDLYNCTISDNRTTSLAGGGGGGEGGGVWLGNGGELNVANTIIAGNFSDGLDAGPSSDCADDDDELITLGYNIFGDATGCDTGPDDQTVADVSTVLLPLDENGGPSRTHALILGPAVDAGDPTGCVFMDYDTDELLPVTTDQRGKFRPDDGDDNGSFLCDIGAFELAPSNFGVVFSTIYEEFARGLYLHDHNAYQTPDEQGPITLFAGDFVPIPLGLDAVDVQANGDLLFSTDHSGFAYHTGGLTYIRESNVYRLDGTGAILPEVDFAGLWIGVQGLDAVDKIGVSTYAFSTKRSQYVFHAGGFLYLNHASVYLLDAASRTITLLYDLSPIRLRDLDGLDVLPDGRLAFSTATSQMLWVPFPSFNARQEDIYIYDPADGSVTLFFDGSVAQIDTLDALSIAIGTE